ncbi:hypothetical protein KVV02_004714 [Mortierella alpina]|uniref:Uncharacterized protein n=1 Tax=Mortierella alpina TaxID=64518 RepID=A0A9P8CY23_MORAP|nr:hypothetical protein KVV02_004714 [Mortierella alpina]
MSVLATVHSSSPLGGHRHHHHRHQTQHSVRDQTSTQPPLQRKRAVPVPGTDLTSLKTSLSQTSLQEGMQNSRGLNSTSDTSSSTSSLPSLAQAAHSPRLDSAIDLQETPSSSDNKATNKALRVVPADDTQVSQSSRRPAQRPRHQQQAFQNSPYSQSNNSSSNLTLQGHTCSKESKPSPPSLRVSMDGHRSAYKTNTSSKEAGDGDDGEDSYFGDILDKYCHSDDDLHSPSSASPTSPFSTASTWSDFGSPHPPTPPTSSRPRQSADKIVTPPRRATHLRNSISQQSQASSSAESSPMLSASAKFNAYLHAGSNRDSRDSLSLSSQSVSSSNQSSPTPTTRSYSKRPVPVPGGSASTSSPRASVLSTTSFLSQNHSTPDLRESRPEPPAKDSSRRALKSSNSQLSLLSSDSHSPGHLNTISDVVEAARRRTRTVSTSSVSSSLSGINPYADSAATSYGLTPSEMLSQRFDDRARIMRQDSFTSIASSRATNQGGIVSSRAVKSALSKTPIARARAKEMLGPRKVIFGEMITIVSIERPETPPPPPSPADKKKAKKKAKKSSSKAGPHPDPEYDSDYYNAPYTQEPAEVVVTLAPWIGNPNYDEEKQNSKFYYPDEEDEEEGYDDDGYGYNASYENDIRRGPDEDDDDYDEDYDEDEDEDDLGDGGKAWGNGIAGGGGVLPKKKGGIFKFKRAVNRLLRN